MCWPQEVGSCAQRPEGKAGIERLAQGLLEGDGRWNGAGGGNGQACG